MQGIKIEADCWMAGQCWMTMSPNNIRLEVNPMSDGGGLIAPSPDNMGSCAIGNDFFDNFF